MSLPPSALPHPARATLPAPTCPPCLALTMHYPMQVGLPILGVVENMAGLAAPVPALHFTYLPTGATAGAALGVGAAHNVPAPLDVTQRVLDLLRTEVGLGGVGRQVSFDLGDCLCLRQNPGAEKGVGRTKCE